MKLLFAAPLTFDRITFFISQYTIGLARAARALGHEVRVVQATNNRSNPYMGKFLEKEFDILRFLLKPIVDLPHDALLMSQVLREVDEFKPDFLFIYLLDTNYFPFVMHKIKKRGTRIFTWLGLHPSMVSRGIQNLIRASDYAFIYDQDYVDYYKSKLNITNTRIVPLGCDTSFYESVVPDSSFKESCGTDICFVGIFDRHRENFFRAVSAFNLGLWCWNIEEHETPLKKYYKGTVHGENMIKVIKSSKIALNIHRNFETSGGNYRLFEIPACGVLQVVDEKKNVGKFFEIGKEIVTFSDVNDLRAKVKYYLEHPDERERIARAGFERVKRDHTLIDRTERMLKIMA
jgi:spore maturation protein CgeB